MSSSASHGDSGYTGLDELRTMRVTGTKHRSRKGPPTCYQPRPSIEESPPSDGSMKFTVMRQVKESYERFNELRCSNGQLCDVVLASEDGQKFPCHKVILASASPYFYGMFTGGMRECCMPEIPICNISGETLSLIIEFIYTAELTIREQTVERLMPAGMMLQMPHIIEACTTFVESHLDPSNCLDIVHFARQYDCLELAERAEKFLLTQFCDMRMYDQFKKLTIEELQSILSSDELVTSCESEVYKAVMEWICCDCDNRIQHLPTLLSCVRLSRLPPEFISQQLQYCAVLRQAPSQCTEQLNMLFQKLAMHQSVPEPPRHTGDTQVVYCIGGYLSQSVNNVEYWNPHTDEWKRAADIPHARSGLAACTILGKVFAVGGRNNSAMGNEDLSVVDCFNPRSNTWSHVQPMTVSRNRVSVAILDNKLFAMGGSNSGEPLSSVECYDLTTKCWSLVASMQFKRIAAGAAMVNRFLYAIGGTGPLGRTNTMEKYHPEKNEWQTCASMSTARSGAGVCALDPYIFVAGGFDSQVQLRTVERYDTRTDTWTTVASMKQARSALSLVQLDGKLYILGGYGGSEFISTVECYDPAKDEWIEVSSMLSARSGQGVAVGPAPPS